MSLRLRLFISYLGLIAVTALAAGWGLYRLTGDLRQALGQTAQDVVRQALTVLHERNDMQDAALDETTRAKVNAAIERAATRQDRSTEGADRIRRQIRVVQRIRAQDDEARADAPEWSTIELPQNAVRALSRWHVELAQTDARAPLVINLREAGVTLPIAVPHRTVDAALNQFGRRVALGLGVLVLLASALAMALSWRIARPLRQLASSAERLGAGERGVQAPLVRAPREVRQSIEAFNTMSRRLDAYEQEAESSRNARELAELGEIGRGLAHSLRNPLHALGLTLDALARQVPDTASASGQWHAGREQLARVDRTLRSFLALAAGTDAAAAPVELNQIVQDVFLEVAQAGKPVAFDLSGTPLSLPGFEAELRVMLHTLIVNAVEASPPGACVQVQIQAEGVDGARIALLDAGPGPTADIAAQLFQPHVTDKPHGAGMGLYLTRRLARSRYAGDVQLRAAPEGGTLALLMLRPRRHVD